MTSFIACLYIFVYITILCPISEIQCHVHGPKSSYVVDKGNLHKRDSPCATCPRHGKCVPKIQCPAHLRPGSYNPECHLEKSGVIGICCFTGYRHAAETELKARASLSINVKDLKASHHESREKLSEWLQKADKLAQMKDSHGTVVNISTPSYAHHLSVTTRDEVADKLGEGALLNLFAAQELKARQAISDEDLSLGLTEQTDGPFCPPPPFCPSPASRYRSVGGECNNAAFPAWGAAHTPFERLLPPDYSDGIWGMKASSTGLPLPSARTVSSVLVLDGSHPSPTHNMMFMQFGQFLVHDISAGVSFRTSNGSGISCCTSDGEDFLPPEFQHWACAPITADPRDLFFGQFRHKCLNFVRTQLAPASDCAVGYAKQMNGATHCADLSQLYGSSEEKLEVLRGSGGLLKVFNDFGRELPPLTQHGECISSNEGSACFESGDNHGNQVISLAVLHTVFTREHNRIARVLGRLNPAWDEEQVFWEARRILQAEYQHILFNEWLPLLIGPQIMQIFGLTPSSGHSSSYDPLANPSLTSEFSAAAMRFGHSVVDGNLRILNPRSNEVYETISIPEVMFQPSRLRLRHFLDRLLVGLSWQPMQSVDPFVTEGLTRYLFHGGHPFGLDLASINLQRARDWGVRSYNEYRRLNGHEPILDFRQFTPNTAQRLSSVYASPEDIELWIGGLLEEPVEGGIVGITFANIIADQFTRLKRGDRYFYEYGPEVNPGAFTPSQLSEIKKVSLARILCDNSDGIDLFAQPLRAFIRADLSGNEPVPCNSPVIPAVDLTRFKEI